MLRPLVAFTGTVSGAGQVSVPRLPEQVVVLTRTKRGTSAPLCVRSHITRKRTCGLSFIVCCAIAQVVNQGVNSRRCFLEARHFHLVAVRATPANLA